MSDRVFLEMQKATYSGRIGRLYEAQELALPTQIIQLVINQKTNDHS